MSDRNVWYVAQSAITHRSTCHTLKVSPDFHIWGPTDETAERWGYAFCQLCCPEWRDLERSARFAYYEWKRTNDIEVRGG